MKPHSPVCLFFVWMVSLGLLEARTWTQAATKKAIDAEFVRVVGDKVELQLSDGRKAQVPIASLVAEDQLFIRDQQVNESSLAGADWPQWRGPNQDDFSPDTELLSTWPSTGPEKAWTYKDAGMGYSGYSIAGGKLYTLGSRGDDLVVIALNAESGVELWSAVLARDDQSGYSTGWGHGPRSTPTYSDDHLYILGPKGGLFCVSAEDGKKVWEKNLVSDYGGKAGGWGFSESPLVDGEKVVIAPGGGPSAIVALDKKSGSEIWKTSIDGAGKAEYATVVKAEINERQQYVKLFQSFVVGVDAASGELIWRSEWPGKTAVIPTPIVDGNFVYVTSGYGVGSKLFEVKGGTTEDIWMSKDMKNHHGGVVKSGDYLYGFSDGGGLVCQSWKSGDLVWNEKDQYLLKGSVHAADGKLICLNESDGMVSLVAINPKAFELLGQFSLDPLSENRSPKGKIWTHPVVVNGKLYLRDQEFISCYLVK
ncbi:MAG: PQQ-binding-like beta-propeller repeat protein [Verrucomicrobiota bacterium]